MFGFRLLRKFTSIARGLRKFSSVDGGPLGRCSETCVIRGLYQDIHLPATLFLPLDAYEASFPLISKIPYGNLISVSPGIPYEISEQWRHLFFSGFLPSHFCKLQQDSIVNAFDFSNVGVLKGLNMLCFKKLDRVAGIVNCDHADFSSFVKDVFTRFSGPLSLDQFPECEGFLRACEQEHTLDEDVLRNHSFFLGNEKLASLYTDIHRLSRQELKHRGLGAAGKQILADMNKLYYNGSVASLCGKHILLRFLLGSHGPKEVKTALLGGFSRPFPGTTVVDIHRIAVHHAIEDNVLIPARNLYPQLMDFWNNFSRADVIKALRSMYFAYPGQALFSFKAAGVLDYLEMDKRLPTPSIYKYISPAIDVEDNGLQGGSRSWNN